MNVFLIAAIGRSGQLGLGGRLPWHDPNDLKWFREVTMGHVVLVGYRTYQNLPPLPGRDVIVDERDNRPDLVLAPLVGRTVFVAGGANTYKKYLPYVTRSYIVHIDYDGPADVFMPNLWDRHK